MSSISTSVDPLEKRVVPFVEQPLPAKITTAAEYSLIAADLKTTNDFLKEIADHHDPIIASAHKTHYLACQAKKKLEGPLLARKVAEAKLLGDFQAAERARVAAEERTRREAALKVERERQQREADEVRRIASEKAAEEERARNEAEAARQLSAEAFEGFDGQAADEMKAVAESQEEVALRASMERQEAERLAREIETAPVATPAVRVESEVPKVAGIGGRTTWFAEVIDKRKFVEHVLANWAMYENQIDIDMAALNRSATSVKKEIEIAPGVMARPKHMGTVRS